MPKPVSDTTASFSDYLKSWPTYLLPHHFLSRLMHAFARCRVRWLKSAFTRWFVTRFDVDLSEAQDPDLDHYPHFNSFFTRALRPDARPIAAGEDILCCPVDGAISQVGDIQQGQIMQAKGREYSLLELLGGDQQHSQDFLGGRFATLYLSPRDYHRIHMPVAGRLTAMTHVPGRLFSVSPATARTIPRLFARNERVIAYFDTEAGPLALVLVGAIFVASIETVWAGEVTPPAGHEVRHWHYDPAQKAYQFAKGEEIGRFNLGSTVIMLGGGQGFHWLPTARAGEPVRMGQPLARRPAKAAP